jgi:hypothetical protein
MSLYSIGLLFKTIIDIGSMDFTALRILMTGQERVSLHIGISFPLCCSMLFYMRKRNITDCRNIIILCIILLAIISTSKMFFVFALLYIVPWYEREFKLKISIIVAIFLIGFLSFFGLHAATSRMLDDKNVFVAVLRTLNTYLLFGLASFQLSLDGILEIATNSTGWIKAGKAYGNVIAGFQTLFEEKNYFFFYIRIMFLSFLYSVIYYRKTLLFDFLKVYAFFPLLFVFFSDWFFSSMWFGFFLSGIGISFIGANQNEKYLFANNNI